MLSNASSDAVVSMAANNARALTDDGLKDQYRRAVDMHVSVRSSREAAMWAAVRRIYRDELQRRDLAR